MEFRIEQLSDENIADLLPLYLNAFEKSIDLSELKAKFNTSQFGHKNVGFTAYAPNGEAAAFYGVFPIEVSNQNGQFVIAQSGDTMTHKNYRRHGLFVTLAEKTYEFCRENNIHLVYGFPNEFSYMGFIKKLKWKHDESIEAYVTKHKCLPFIRLKRILPKLNTTITKYQNKQISKIAVKPYAYQSIMEDSETTTIKRDQKLFDYKTYFKSYFLKINDKLVWVKLSEMYIYIGDIETCSEPEFKSILLKLNKIAFKLGIPHLRFQCSPNTRLANFLSKIVLKNEIVYPIGYINFTDTIDPSSLKFNLADYDTF